MIIEPCRQENKMSWYLDYMKPRRVLIVFWHGVGDVVQFLGLLDILKQKYPETQFDLGLQKGLDEETLYPSAVLLENLDNIEEGYDITFLIHFPVETDPDLTKSELCCREELGIDPVTNYKLITKPFESKLCAVHFNLTCLPDLVTPEYDVAQQIWNDILNAGWIPIEVHFQHIYHNPVNTKFDFIDCTVRRCIPRLSSLIGLLQRCGAFIGVVSGPFHCALATMNTNRIAYLEKEIPNRFTRENIQVFNLKDYRGGVGLWLGGIV